MIGTMKWRSAVVMAALLLLGYGCGSKDCPSDSPDADAEVTEDTTVEPDTIEDTSVPEADAVEDTVEEDVEEEDGVLPVDCSAIAEHVTQEGLLVHLEALETIATDNGGTRVTGTPGWDASIDYIEAQLEDFGYTPTRMDVEYPYFEETIDPALRMITPTAHTYTFSEDDPVVMTGDFQRIHFSRPGDVTAEVTAVDLELGPGNTSSSGCEPGDFAGFTAGHIALIQRGTCPFITKATNAEAAGASAMLLFNQGNTTEREGLMLGGASFVDMIPIHPEHGINIPAVCASYTVGEGIATALASGTVVMRLQVFDVFEIRPSQNLLAETTAGDPDDVVIYGAHLDSDPDSPGINDNATGLASVLEIARLVAECDPTRKFRFGFWATEEWRGPWGSLQYVASLSDTELAQIFGYINVDMIGSPNYALFVLDGDGSDFWIEGPPGSAELERFFIADFMFQGYSTAPFWGTGSDHFGFFMAGVAYGCVYTGGGLLGDSKTDEEVVLFGGTAGEKYDPCHHEACDNIDNLNLDIYEVVAKSLTRSAQFFGLDGMVIPPLP